MSFWGRVFGSDYALKKTVDGVVSGIDALAFTDEERAEFNKSMINTLGNYMQSTSGQNIARRMIALIVSVIWSVLVVASVTCALSGFDEAATIMYETLDSHIDQPFMMIIGFYFGIQAVREFRKK